MEVERPEIFVLGGPNGAGKTTVAGLLLPESLGVRNFVNADLIAQGLSPHAPEASAFSAGRLMIGRIRELRDLRVSFGFESTLASKTFAPFLREARSTGYLVHVLYVSLAHPDLAVRRIDLRVQRGGHRIPEVTIRRRYTRSLFNFYHLYRPLADSWLVADNSGDALVHVAHGRRRTEPTIVDEVRWERLLRRVDSHGP